MRRVFAGATVSILSATGTAPYANAVTTDASGNYLLGSITEGRYIVGAGGTGYATEFQPITLTSSQTLDFDLPLAPAR